MMLSKADTLVLDKTSGTISAVLSPIIKLMQLPGQLIYGGYEQVIDIANVYKENKLLKLENSELLMLKNKVRTLQAENKILGDMLNYEQLPEAKFITAKVVAEEGDGFSHSLIVYIGDNKTIYKDQVAIGNGSVVGRVESVMDKYARVILITDIGSKIPVIVERSRESKTLPLSLSLFIDNLFICKKFILNKDIASGN